MTALALHVLFALPQAPPARGADVPRIRAPFKRAMTFVRGLVEPMSKRSERAVTLIFLRCATIS